MNRWDKSFVWFKEWSDLDIDSLIVGCKIVNGFSLIECWKLPIRRFFAFNWMESLVIIFLKIHSWLMLIINERWRLVESSVEITGWLFSSVDWTPHSLEYWLLLLKFVLSTTCLWWSHIFLLPFLSILHKEIEEVSFLRGNAWLVLVDEDRLHDQCVKNVKVVFAFGFSDLLLILFLITACVICLERLGSLLFLHKIRMKEFFMLHWESSLSIQNLFVDNWLFVREQALLY